MCGIAGIFDPDRPSEATRVDIEGMLANIGHRGPDGSGYVFDNGFAMGTVRLAILDPAGGAQPFEDDSGRYWLCYNGEIYNYRELRADLEALGCVFRTTCDTEVVLNAWIKWGPDCLPKFNGGFSFALYDCVEERLFLARDRFGKRPLFFTRHGKAFIFASEMKAFLAIKDFAFEQDQEQLSSILAQWTPLPTQTGFHGIENLAMGQWLSFEKGEAFKHTYASLSFDDGPEIETEAQALSCIRKSLTESVTLRLRSDVEVGVYLSGGVDSAIVADIANDVTNHPLSTFSVEFEDPEFDESADQKLVADHLGTRHHSQSIRHSDIAAAMPDAVFHAEMPTFRSAFVPMFILSKRTQSEGIKVILSGEGADEAFLGYDLFKETLLRGEWDELPEDVRRSRLKNLYPHLSHYGADDIAAIIGLYQQFSQEKMTGLFSHELRFQNGHFSNRLLKDAKTPFAAISGFVSSHHEYQSFSPVEKAQWLEYKTLLPGYLLSTQGERMGLAHGVENRCPFLDPNVVALASSINLKFDDGFKEKFLLREAFRHRLPEKIIDKRKFPYRAPDAAAFAAVRPDYLEQLLSMDELTKIPFLNAKFAERLANKVLSTDGAETSTKENQTFLFLLSICMLHRRFVRREKPQTAKLPPLEKIVDLKRDRSAHSSQGSFNSVT